MPKKSPGERWRYIAFSLNEQCEISRSAFLDAVFKKSRGTSLENQFRITVFGGGFGILKVPHHLKDDGITVLNSIDSIAGEDCSVTTLKTSGTIKTLKAKYKDRIQTDS